VSTDTLVPGVLVALLANLVFAILVALAAIVLGRTFWRHRVRAFFGIRPNKGELPIYLSNIIVKPSGTTGTAPIVQGFYGTAISEVEYFYALQFANTVETRPIYRALRALDPGDIFTPVEPIVCEIQISPSTNEVGEPTNADIIATIREKVGRRSVVLVGAPIYNTLTLHLMDKLSSHFSFIREEGKSGEPVRGIRMHRGRDNHRDYVRQPIDDSGRLLVEYYLIEKLTWPVRSDTSGHRRSTKVFICAGTCSAATAAALRALARNWPKLQQLTDGTDFGLVCELLLENIELREGHPPDDDELRILDRYGYDGELS
jgi:hypothetical protein